MPANEQEEIRSMYQTLRKAGLSKDFLQSNSATHSFLLGAIAEIVDNAKDAEAKHLDIAMEIFNGKDCLSFLDNGTGMSPEELSNVIKIGWMEKAKNEKKVGRYGCGLKAGSMRLAHECLVLTKKKATDLFEGSRSALLISRNFLDKNNLNDVHVAMPSYQLNADKPLVDEDGAIGSLYQVENEVIMKYTGCEDVKVFFRLFDRIEEQGTLVMLFNLRSEVTGEPQLDWATYPEDIRTRESDDALPLERTSLREYLKLLYYEPTMTINLCGRPVLIQRPVSELYLSNAYIYKPKNMQHAQELEIKRRQLEVQKVAETLTDMREKYGRLQKGEDQMANKNFHKELRIMQNKILACEQELKEAESRLCAKQNPAEEKIFCGYYPYKKKIAGALIYINGRLVEAVQTLDCQRKANTDNLKGLTAIVNLPTSILVPTTNKQGLESTKDRATLLKVLNDNMKSHYENVVQPLFTKEQIEEMWRKFGCSTQEDLFPQKLDHAALTEIHTKIRHTVLCRLCLQWRKVPYSANLNNEKNITGWMCAYHPNADKRKCGVPEKTLDPDARKFIPSKNGRDEKPIIQKKAPQASASSSQIVSPEKKPPRTPITVRTFTGGQLPRIPLKAQEAPIAVRVQPQPRLPEFLFPQAIRAQRSPDERTERIASKKRRFEDTEKEPVEDVVRRSERTFRRNEASSRIEVDEEDDLNELVPAKKRAVAIPAKSSRNKRPVPMEEEEDEDVPQPRSETRSERASRRNGVSSRPVEEEDVEQMDDIVPEERPRTTRSSRGTTRRFAETEEEAERSGSSNGEAKPRPRMNGTKEEMTEILEDVLGLTADQAYELNLVFYQLLNHGIPTEWGDRVWNSIADLPELIRVCYRARKP